VEEYFGVLRDWMPADHLAHFLIDAVEALEQLAGEVQQLLAKAAQADATPLQDGLTIPGEIVRRQPQAPAHPRRSAKNSLKSLAGEVARRKKPGSDQKASTSLSADGKTGKSQHRMIPSKMAKPFCLAAWRTKSDTLPGAAEFENSPCSFVLRRAGPVSM
jgi:hypothetical protein